MRFTRSIIAAPSTALTRRPSTRSSSPRKSDGQISRAARRHGSGTGQRLTRRPAIGAGSMVSMCLRQQVRARPPVPVIDASCWPASSTCDHFRRSRPGPSSGLALPSSVLQEPVELLRLFFGQFGTGEGVRSARSRSCRATASLPSRCRQPADQRDRLPKTAASVACFVAADELARRGNRPCPCARSPAVPPRVTAQDPRRTGPRW